MNPSRACYPGILLLSLAGIILQLQITRLLSVSTLYHFAFVAISLALCGLGAGALHARKRYGALSPLEGLATAARFCYLLAGFSSLALLIVLVVPFGIASAPLLSVVAIGMCLSSLTVCFFLGGVAITLVLWKFPARFGALYGFDLFGGALAGPVLVGLYWLVPDGPAVWLAASLIAWVAGRLFDPHGASPASPAWRRAIWLPAGLLALQIGAVLAGRTLLPVVWLAGQRASALEFETWNFFSRVAVEKKLQPASGWGVPAEAVEAAEAGGAKQKMMLIDGLAGTGLVEYSGRPEQVEFLRRDITNMAHYLRRDGDALVIGVGGGRDVLSSLIFGQRSTTGVEINSGIIAAIRDRFGNFTGHLADRPGVKLVVDEARSYLERNQVRPDLIMVSMIDTWAANSAGAFVLTENSLYTVDAWKVFLRRLKPQGLLSVSRWYRAKLPGELYRVMTLAGKSLREVGVSEPGKHVLVFTLESEKREDSIATILVSPSPLSAEAVATARSKAEELGFRVALAPDSVTDPLLKKLLDNPEDRELLASLPLDVSAPTDDRPYFFQMMRLSDSLSGRTVDQGAMQHNVQATVLLVNTCLIVIFIAGVALGPPIREQGRQLLAAKALPRFVYFAGIGLGYMFVEFALLQRFNLILGHPFYAMTVILGGLLLASGLGSCWWPGSRTRRRAVGWVSVAACLAFVLGFDELKALTVELPQSGRLAATLLTAFAVGFPLGGMMATGLGALPDPDTEMPLCWAINGFASVVGSVMSVVSSLYGGIALTAWMGLLCYLVCALMLTAMRPAESGL